MKSSSRCPTARFLQCRTVSFSPLLDFCPWLVGNQVRSYATRMRALSPLYMAWSYGSLSSSSTTTAKQRSLIAEDETGLRSSTSAPRNFPFWFLQLNRS